ncbi:SGNH hydrolase-type esterase domain-containing protein [Tanacetum coccineum]
MVYFLRSSSFIGFLVILMVVWSGSLYGNGCYTSIISFGDSLTDTGNAKQVASIIHQQYSCSNPPYGVTFFHEPTGRCSDGRLIIDFLAESLGLPFIQPIMYDKGSEIGMTMEQGANFAVGGSTALNSSFLEAIGIPNSFTDTSLGVQLAWFKQALPSICGNVSECRNLIGSSLILMGEIGGNDYIYGLVAGKHIDDVKQLVPLVIDTIVSAINELIEMGARTIVIPGNFPIGCSSLLLTTSGSQKKEYDPTTGCLIELNEFIEYHHDLLQMKLNQIREFHPDVNVIYADYYNASMQIYRSPDKFGFKNGALKACCGGGGPFNYNSSAECGSASATMCDQPDTYVSWDGLHLTEATYKLVFKNIFQGPYTTPQFNSLCPISTSQFEVELTSSM